MSCHLLRGIERVARCDMSIVLEVGSRELENLQRRLPLFVFDLAWGSLSFLNLANETSIQKSCSCSIYILFTGKGGNGGGCANCHRRRRPHVSAMPMPISGELHPCHFFGMEPSSKVHQSSLYISSLCSYQHHRQVAMKHSGLQRDVLSLYRKCLRVSRTKGEVSGLQLSYG